MPFTPTSLYCSNCDCQQLKTRKSYTLKGGAICQLSRSLSDLLRHAVIYKHELVLIAEQ